MSLGIYLSVTVDTGGAEPHTFELWEASPTYNLTRMWKAAGLNLSEWEGRSASECVRELQLAVERMEADPDKFKALNPPNGWGDYDGLLEVLTEFRDHCEAHPKAKVTLWR